ncbi:hypothetical protein KOR34_24470 [Posidoniimonas corsicana]|uniref:Tll0287-like domain-containing protein n=1 Tax=Posidoniimonas corsicana TaxID=1938618 RepID=A0A5C5VIA5_9BACT|nr:DUF3365 domain-containing protein [Posidoniimonas corsicana]TWT37495.1 hypothetical protein KOR34_24470 [Posidoniimonas corsicana]
MTSKTGRWALAVVAAAGLTWLAPGGAAEENPAAPKDPELDRKRTEVRMLDDIYKSGIVTITEHYVNDEDMIPAGTAFKKMFEAAEKKGWHRVRLIDASGEPYSDENVAEDAFEKDAVKRLVKGEPWVEAVEVRDGTRHLRVATPIPVVFEKCIMCHDNYEEVPKGQAIGALTYLVPIDGPLVTKRSKAGK